MNQEEYRFEITLNERGKEVIRIDQEGFHYKGEFIADASEAHRLMVAFLKQNTAQPEQKVPTDEELKTFACEWWNKFAFVKDKATYTWVMDEINPEHFVDFSRDLLARWGH